MQKNVLFEIYRRAFEAEQAFRGLVKQITNSLSNTEGTVKLIFASSFPEYLHLPQNHATSSLFQNVIFNSFTLPTLKFVYLKLTPMHFNCWKVLQG